MAKMASAVFPINRIVWLMLLALTLSPTPLPLTLSLMWASASHPSPNYNRQDDTSWSFWPWQMAVPQCVSISSLVPKWSVLLPPRWHRPGFDKGAFVEGILVVSWGIVIVAIKQSNGVGDGVAIPRSWIGDKERGDYHLRWRGRGVLC